MPPFLRHAAEPDTEALYDICVRTADAGQDARGRLDDDRLWGDLFAVPYLVLAPDHTYVLDDGTGQAVGYVVGTADTAAFAARLRDEWVPLTRDRIPMPPDPAVTLQDNLRAVHYQVDGSGEYYGYPFVGSCSHRIPRRTNDSAQLLSASGT